MVALRCRHPPGIPSARLVIPSALQEEKRAGSHAACRQPSCPAWHVPSHQHEQAGGASGHCQPRDTANPWAELHSPAPSPRSARPGVCSPPGGSPPAAAGGAKGAQRDLAAQDVRKSLSSARALPSSSGSLQVVAKA